MEYVYIAITPRYTLTLCGSVCKGSYISMSQKDVCENYEYMKPFNSIQII